MNMNFLLGALLVSLVLVILFAVRRDRKNPPSEKQSLSEDRMQLVCAEGCTIIASAGPAPQPENLPKPTDDCIAFNESRWQRTYECGHRGPKTFQLNMWGIESKKFNQKEQCPACRIERIKKYTIRCALCGLPIFPGRGVALYHESSPGIRREVGTKVGNSFVGCLRWDCCPCGGFFAGYWTEDGFQSAFEDELTATETAFKTGETVISNA